MAVTTEAFFPFNQSAFGSERVFDPGFAGLNTRDGGNWPPYDMVRTADGFQIIFALAGFANDELSVTFQPNLLTVAGAKADEDKGQYLYQGITERSFVRRFALPNYVEVRSASLKDGLLKIDLSREIPEAAYTRKIEIASAPNEKGASPDEAPEAVANNKAAA